MDAIISKASNQAVTFAIRSGISLASGYAVKTVGKYLETQRRVSPESSASKRLARLQTQLESRVRVLTETFSLVRLLATVGRAETWDPVLELIELLETELSTFTISVDETPETVEKRIKALTSDINELIPVLNLALTTANVTHMYYYSPDKISLTSLLRLYDRMQKARVSPEKTSFDLKFYSIFYNPARISENSDSLLAISWKETYARCKAYVTEDQPFRYTLVVEESFDDERYHEDDEEPRSMRYNVDIIQKMFFTRLGSLLKLDNGENPVLILKLVDDGKEEWLAFGTFEESESDDEDDDHDDEDEVNDEKDDDSGKTKTTTKDQRQKNVASAELGILETLIRLYKFEQAEKKHILNATDAKLAIYLNKDESQSVLYQSTASSLSSQELQSNISRLDSLKLA